MVKLTNPRCIKYVRSKKNETNTSVVESALLKRFGFPEIEKRSKSNRGRKKDSVSSVRAFPVKITDQRLIKAILELRKNGVIQRHTVESALLDMMEKES